jgi:hypothetical protein
MWMNITATAAIEGLSAEEDCIYILKKNESPMMLAIFFQSPQDHSCVKSRGEDMFCSAGL